MAKERIKLFKNDQYQVQGTAMFFMSPTHRPMYLDAFYPAYQNVIKHYNEGMGDSEDVKEIADIYFSGPIRYGNANAIKKDSIIINADLVSAYATFLINNSVPGSRRTRFDGYVAPREGEINCYTFEFAEDNPSRELIEWFLSADSFKHKIKSYGDRGIKGRINIMASKKLFDLYDLFRKHCPSAKLISTVVCFGREKVYINRESITTQLVMKYQGHPIAKKVLTQSMGNLSRFDKFTFYWMVQCVKARVLTQLIKDVPLDSVVAMNTDGVLIAFDEKDIDGMANYIMSLEQYTDVEVEIGVDIKIRGTQVFKERNKQNEGLH